MSIYYKYAPDGYKLVVLYYVGDCVYCYTYEELLKWFVCFKTTSTVLSAVRVRVRAASRPAQHARALWFWVHGKDIIGGSYIKVAWVHTSNNGGNVASFNFYNLCYQMNQALLSPVHAGKFSVAPWNDVKIFHDLVNQFIRPPPSHVWTSTWQERKGGRWNERTCCPINIMEGKNDFIVTMIICDKNRTAKIEGSVTKTSPCNTLAHPNPKP